MVLRREWDLNDRVRNTILDFKKGSEGRRKGLSSGYDHKIYLERGGPTS